MILYPNTIFQLKAASATLLLSIIYYYALIVIATKAVMIATLSLTLIIVVVYGFFEYRNYLFIYVILTIMPLPNTWSELLPGISLTQIAVFVLFILLVFHSKTKQEFALKPFPVYLKVMFVIFILSYPMSHLANGSTIIRSIVVGRLGFTTFLTVFIVFHFAKRKEDIEFIFSAILSAVVILVIVSLLGFFTGYNMVWFPDSNDIIEIYRLREEYERLAVIMLSTYIGYYCVVGLIITYYFYLKNKLHSCIAICLATLFMITMLYASSRMALIELLLALIIVIFTMRGTKILLFGVFSLCLALMMIANNWIPDILLFSHYRLLSVFDISHGPTAGHISDWKRFGLWLGRGEWFWGVGYLNPMNDVFYGWQKGRFHSITNIWADAGISGFFSFVMLWFGVIFISLKNYLLSFKGKKHDALEVTLFLLSFVTFLTFIVLEMNEARCTWIIMACCYAYYDFQKRQKPKKNTVKFDSADI